MYNKASIITAAISVALATSPCISFNPHNIYNAPANHRRRSSNCQTTASRRPVLQTHMEVRGQPPTSELEASAIQENGSASSMTPTSITAPLQIEMENGHVSPTSSSTTITPEQAPQENDEPPSYAAQTLDGRLLCASQCAYEISSPYIRASAYRPTTTAKRITRGANSALIGFTTDGITIAFRGTQTTSVLDWLQNAALFLSDVDESKFKIKGQIHTGFYRGTKNLWKPLKGVLKEMLEECDQKGWKKNVYLTGHSKGGAMASIASVLMKRDPELPDAEYVCTFASARLGDSQFRDAFNQRVNQTSYEAYLDIVPFLPPSASTMEAMSDKMSEMIEGLLWSKTSSSKKDKFKWDYQTLGNRKYINREGEIISDVTRELDAQRINEIEEKTILSLDAFKKAHCSGCVSEGCGGNYFDAIAGGICNVVCVEGDEDTVGDASANADEIIVGSEKP